MNPTNPTAGSAPGSALPQKTGETRASTGAVSWCVILYLRDDEHDGDRSLIGPFTTLRDAEHACKTLDGYGDLEIRRVESLPRVLAAIEHRPLPPTEATP